MAKVIQYEAGQNLVDFVELTDSGDNAAFNSSVRRWSDYPGRRPEIRPNLILSGGRVTPAVSGDDDVVDVSAINCYLNGADKTGTNQIAADTDVAVTRGSAAYLIASVVVTSAGAIDVVEGADTAGGFSETRGAAGGPPYIAVDAIEVAQIRLSSSTSGPITADEIKAVPGVHREAYRAFNIDYARVTDRVQGYAGVTFPSALNPIHTGDAAPKVYVKYYTPLMATLEDVRDFEAPGITGSVTSETFYSRSVADVTTSLGSGSFEFAPRTGVDDDILGHENRPIWFIFYPDDLDTSKFVQTQATLFFSGNFPAEGVTLRSATLVAKKAADLVVA